MTEQSRDRFTLEDVNTASTMLGFGVENLLRVEYDEDVEDEFIENAWRSCVKRSWQDLQHGSETLRHANDSFRILAETRGSVKLWKLWENGKNMYMNPDRAYSTLEVPKEFDDTMLITVYNMRVCFSLRLLLWGSVHSRTSSWRKHQHSWKKCERPCLSSQRCATASD